MKQDSIPEEVFWAVIVNSTTINILRSYDHGPTHWARVLRNGLMLAKQTDGADIAVVRLFALFHDSMRDNEWHDPDHGKRGYELAYKMGAAVELLTDEQHELFREAVVRHDLGETSSDPTIGVCWDADRLDLPRVGIVPNPSLLSTDAARTLLTKNEGRIRVS